MLTSLSNYLFGSKTVAETNEDIDLKTRFVEKDWVIVDLPNEDCLVSGSDQPSETLVLLNVGSSSDSASSSPCHLTPGSLSPVGQSQYCFKSRIDTAESWILSPPPCFTAGGHDSSEVAMTPMENLLIEHPSMSVYKQKSHPHHDSDGEDSNISESSNQEKLVLSSRSGLRPRHGRIVGQPPRQARAVAARAGLLQNIHTIKASQRKCRQHETRRFTRSQLKRTNKANVVSSHGRHDNQRSRKQCPSGCINGRIGQRKH